MKTVYLLFASLLLFSACDNDDPDEAGMGVIEFLVKPLYNGQELQLDELYRLDANGQISFSRFSFFIHNLTLEGGILSDVDYWKILEAQTASEGVLARYIIPEGTYVGLGFDIGLPQSINDQNPADFPSDSPLADFAEYWEAWSSYIFTKIEGKGDFDNDGDVETNIAFHIGGNSSYRQSFTEIPVQIQANETTTLTLEFDLHKMLFPDSGDPFDIRSVNRTHTLELLPEAQKILDNLLSSLTISR